MASRIPLPPHLHNAPFTYAEGLESGLGRNRLRGRDLARPFHGIRLSAHLPLDTVTRCRAFMKRMPVGGFFSSVTAAVLLGLPLPLEHETQRDLHVAVPLPARASSARGIRGHAVTLMGGDVQSVAGVPASSPERVWCELGAILSLGDLVAVGDHLIRWRSPLTSLARLTAALRSYPGRRGRRNLSLAIDLLDDRAESRRESLLRVILVLAGVDGFEANYPVEVRRRHFRLDLAFPLEKVCLEYQGDHHRGQWRKDMTRNSILTSDGWRVLEFNADDLRNPAELVERVRAALVRGGRH